MAKPKIGFLVISIGGHVVALDPATGVEFWRTKLKTSSFVTVRHEGVRVFAGAGGELFCLDAASGNIRWHNKLKGLGLSLVSFAAGTDAAAFAALQEEAAAAAG